MDQIEYDGYWTLVSRVQGSSQKTTWRERTQKQPVPKYRAIIFLYVNPVPALAYSYLKTPSEPSSLTLIFLRVYIANTTLTNIFKIIQNSTPEPEIEHGICWQQTIYYLILVSIRLINQYIKNPEWWIVKRTIFLTIEILTNDGCASPWISGNIIIY